MADGSASTNDACRATSIVIPAFKGNGAAVKTGIRHAMGTVEQISSLRFEGRR